MVRHPKRLGFKLGLKIRIGRPAKIIKATRDAQNTQEIVYVALIAEKRSLLKKGDVLKIGQTGRTLKERWEDICRIFEPGRKLRKNEKHDRDKWLEAADGRTVAVWAKVAEKVEVPYAKGLTRSRFSLRWAEEEFLDQYYGQSVGKSLCRNESEQSDLRN
jgi:hypothetical protein